jgi:hypothetical protein
MQRIESGKLFPLFASYRRLELDLEGGVTARFEFEGDLFEMEDQRNWTDASFKTYSTPITLGFPHDAPAGHEIVQTVRLTVRQPEPDDDAVRLELGEAGTFLPPFGLVLGEEPSERESERLLAIRLDHLRVELDLDGDWRPELERAGSVALSLGAALELVLAPGDDAQLDELAAALPLVQAKVARVLVLPREGVVSGAEDVRRAREKLGTAAGAATFAAGTDLWFTELNRTRPDLEGVDGVFYSTAATVHADDDTSVMETPAAHGDTVRSARAIAGRRDAHVGPITLRPRSWPFGNLAGYRGLPYQVDQRQPTLIGAAWTAASLKHVAEARASSATYFETTGWRGVMEREHGSPAPDVFRSRAGGVFPLYHVLADYGEWRGTTLLVHCRSSRPLAVEALAARTNEGHHVLVANLTPDPQRCTVGPLESGRVALRTLDETTAVQAVEDPDAFRAAREERPVREGRIELELAPYAVVRVDPA